MGVEWRSISVLPYGAYGFKLRNGAESIRRQLAKFPSLYGAYGFKQSPNMAELGVFLFLFPSPYGAYGFKRICFSLSGLSALVSVPLRGLWFQTGWRYPCVNVGAIKFPSPYGAYGFKLWGLISVKSVSEMLFPSPYGAYGFKPHTINITGKGACDVFPSPYGAYGFKQPLRKPRSGTRQ